MSIIITLQDIKDLKAQKERELEFYSEQLEQLKLKLFFIQKNIRLTEVIISIIEEEKKVDIRELINDSNR